MVFKNNHRRQEPGLCKFDTRPGPCRVIVKDGAIQEGQREYFNAINIEGLSLTPENRLGAINEWDAIRENAKLAKEQSAKYARPPGEEKISRAPVEEIVVEELMDNTERYIQLSALVKRDAILNDDERAIEREQDSVPWEEVKAA